MTLRLLASLGVACLGIALAIIPGPASAQKAEPTSPKAAVVVTEPRDIVATLYKNTAIALKKERPSSPFFDHATRRKYFSKGFDQLITKSETEAVRDGSQMIDFDPITASQDTDMTSATVKTNVLELGKAVVSASFTNFGKPAVVTYDFVKEDGAWAIDDIKGTTDKEAWSVRKILKGTGKEPTALPGMNDAVAKPPAPAK